MFEVFVIVSAIALLGIYLVLFALSKLIEAIDLYIFYYRLEKRDRTKEIDDPPPKKRSRLP